MSSPLFFRASSTTGYVACQLRAAVHAFPRQFQDAGWDLAQGRSSVGALAGSGYHAALELGLRGSMKGERSPSSLLEEAGVAGFRQRYMEEPGPVEYDDETSTLDQAEAQVVRMVRRWHADVYPQLQPVAVESRLYAELRPGIVLSGQGDLLALDRGQTVVDHKSTRRWSPAHQHAPQLGCYSLLYRSKGHDTQRCRVDMIRRNRLSVPQEPVRHLELPLAQAEVIAQSVLQDFTTKMEGFVADGDASRFIPNPQCMLCSPRFCRAHGRPVCPATYQP